MLQSVSRVKMGIDRLGTLPDRVQTWGRCGLVANQASVTQGLQTSWQVCRDMLGDQLTALFGPQHGFESTVQDNMIETGHSYHRPTGLPVYSLYGETRWPTPDMLHNVDTLLFDLQIVGCRVYTYKATLLACLKTVKALGKKMVVLDRPNPVGGTLVEGRILDDDIHSFVGSFAIPLRHGLTMGEMALLMNTEIAAELEVVGMEGWDPTATWDGNGLHWVLTSPNLPTTAAVSVYPGGVLFEGTNVSEGRGTGLPFQFVGAPYLSDPGVLVRRTLELAGDLAGVQLRTAEFQPTSQKWREQTCQGVQLHVDTHALFPAVRLGLALLRGCIELGGKAFAFNPPGYEYDNENLPINMLFGSKATLSRLSAPTFDMADAFWHEGLEDWCERAHDVLLYPRTLQPC